MGRRYIIGLLMVVTLYEARHPCQAVRCLLPTTRRPLLLALLVGILLCVEALSFYGASPTPTSPQTTCPTSLHSTGRSSASSTQSSSRSSPSAPTPWGPSPSAGGGRGSSWPTQVPPRPPSLLPGQLFLLECRRAWGGGGLHSRARLAFIFLTAAYNLGHVLALVVLVSIDPRGADPGLGLTYSSTHILLLVMTNMWALPLTPAGSYMSFSTSP